MVLQKGLGLGVVTAKTDDKSAHFFLHRLVKLLINLIRRRILCLLIQKNIGNLISQCHRHRRHGLANKLIVTHLLCRLP